MAIMNTTKNKFKSSSCVCSPENITFVNGNKQTALKKSESFVLRSPKDSNTRDGRMEKRRKVDCSVKHHCCRILESLINHRAARVFCEPMGTVKRKLERDMYLTVDEFKADVRLIFSNAVLYNFPYDDVYKKAKELDHIFNRSWKSLEEKWNLERINGEHIISSGTAKNTIDSSHTCLLKSPARMSSFTKRPMSPGVQNMQRNECVKKSNGSLDVGVGPANVTRKRRNSWIAEIVHKGTDNARRSVCDLANIEQPLSSVASKCVSPRSVILQSSLQNEHALASLSDASPEISQGHVNARALKLDGKVKNKQSPHISKSDPDSDGAASTLDEENICSNPHLSTPATTASRLGGTPLIDVQLSPKQALRVAMLKSRYADTIFKAKLKVLDVGQQKIGLENQKLEEKSRIESQIIAAESATRLKVEAELKMQRERERQASRIALQKVKMDADFDNHDKTLKDFEQLIGCSLPDQRCVWTSISSH